MSPSAAWVKVSAESKLTWPALLTAVLTVMEPLVVFRRTLPVELTTSVSASPSLRTSSTGDHDDGAAVGADEVALGDTRRGGDFGIEPDALDGGGHLGDGEGVEFGKEGAVGAAGGDRQVGDFGLDGIVTFPDVGACKKDKVIGADVWVGGVGGQVEDAAGGGFGVDMGTEGKDLAEGDVAGGGFKGDVTGVGGEGGAVGHSDVVRGDKVDGLVGRLGGNVSSGGIEEDVVGSVEADVAGGAGDGDIGSDVGVVVAAFVDLGSLQEDVLLGGDPCVVGGEGAVVDGEGAVAEEEDKAASIGLEVFEAVDGDGGGSAIGGNTVDGDVDEVDDEFVRFGDEDTVGADSADGGEGGNGGFEVVGSGGEVGGHADGEAVG